METTATMTPAKCSALWLHCSSLGGCERGMVLAAQARRDIRAGHLDTAAVGWAVSAYNQIPADRQAALLAEYAATCP